MLRPVVWLVDLGFRGDFCFFSEHALRMWFARIRRWREHALWFHTPLLLFYCFFFLFLLLAPPLYILSLFSPHSTHTVWRNFLRALGLLVSRIKEGGKWGEEEIQKVWAPWGGKCSSLPSFSPLPFPLLSSSHLSPLSSLSQSVPSSSYRHMRMRCA